MTYDPAAAIAAHNAVQAVVSFYGGQVKSYVDRVAELERALAEAGRASAERTKLLDDAEAIFEQSLGTLSERERAAEWIKRYTAARGRREPVGGGPRG